MRIPPITAQVLGLALAAGSLGLVPVALLLERSRDPDSTVEGLMWLLFLTLPVICFLFLILLVRRLLNDYHAPQSLRDRARMAFWVAGPIGGAWAVLFLTRTVGREQAERDAATPR